MLRTEEIDDEARGASVRGTGRREREIEYQGKIKVTPKASGWDDKVDRLEAGTTGFQPRHRHQTGKRENL